MADAERHGQVADAARVRLGMEPIALDDEQLARIAERGRTDLAEAVAGLPESQRMTCLRRVLGEQEYPEIAAHRRLFGAGRPPARLARPGGIATRAGGAMNDPFDLFRDQLVRVATPRRRRRHTGSPSWPRRSCSAERRPPPRSR